MLFLIAHRNTRKARKNNQGEKRRTRKSGGFGLENSDRGFKYNRVDK